MSRTIRLETAGVALLAVLAVFSLVRRDLFIGDETKYAQVVREMHADATLLVPTLNGEPYTHKPPLHFWLMYGLTGLAGQKAVWPYVLPALVSFLGLIWLTGRIASDWLDRKLVWPARFFMAGFALVWGLAQSARMDLMFALFTTAGSLSLFRYFDSNRRREAWMGGLWFGIAGLLKGPMAILIAASLFVFESLAAKRRPRLADLALFGVIALIPLVWFVPAVASAGQGYLDEIVTRQTAGRLVGSWVHREPPWYYLMLSPAIAMPWFFVLAGAFGSAGRARSDEERRALSRCIRWALAILVPFSLISSKLPVYMVPAFPPMAIAASWFASLKPEAMRWRAFVMWGNGLLLALFAITSVGLLWFTPENLEADVATLVSDAGVRAGLVAMLLISVGGLGFCWRSVREGSFALPFVVAVPLGIMLLIGAPAVNDYASSRPMAEELAAQSRRGDSIAMYYTPHLWSRSLPAELEGARQTNPESLGRGEWATLLVVRADKVEQLAGVLDEYREISTVRMMGKAFHVYRRR